MQSDLIPLQKRGSKTGASAELKANSRHDAIGIFQEAKQKLLSINHWKTYCGDIGAEFTHTDADGNTLLNRKPEVGDLIRIKLPAPINKHGDGFDWVRIEKFESENNVLRDEEIFGFRVRPVANPLDNGNSEPAHFYTSSATSTFLIVRSSNTVTAMERARNEVPNTEAPTFWNKIRNAVIAFAAMLGVSNPQWKLLMKGILHYRPSPETRKRTAHVS